MTEGERLKGAETVGMLLGFVGVLMFSLTLPFTRIAVTELEPYFVTFARSTLGGICALLVFAVRKPSLPTQNQFFRIIVVALSVVYGFPLFVALAMKSLPSAHGGIVLGVLPLATAAAGALRFKEHPSVPFWLVAAIGSGLVVIYAFLNGSGGLEQEDWLLFLAVASAAIGYAEGGKLSEELGAINVISWALVLTLPFNILLTSQSSTTDILAASPMVAASLIYVGVISMYVGFFFWYKGIALGGIARVGQVQLLQPFLTLIGAYFLLNEPITAMNVGFALCVLFVVIVGRRVRAR